MKENKGNSTKGREVVGFTVKEAKEEQKIDQIEGIKIKVRFSDTGLHLEHLVTAYIKEKLFIV